MATLTDFHSHILPNIDDGSSSVEESVAMLRLMAEQGIKRVVATPHFMPNLDTPESFIEKRNESERLLRSAMEGIDGLPELEMGAEVYFFRGMSESETLPMLSIGNTGAILIEMPPAPWSETIFRELDSIWTTRRLLPIIAHVERYITPFTAKKVLRRLAGMHVLVQSNASFFTDKRSSSLALRLLKKRMIHLIGSDCHGIESRVPNMQGAISVIEGRLGIEAIERIAFYEDSVLGAKL